LSPSQVICKARPLCDEWAHQFVISSEPRDAAPRPKVDRSAQVAGEHARLVNPRPDNGYRQPEGVGEQLGDAAVTRVIGAKLGAKNRPSLWDAEDIAQANRPHHVYQKETQCRLARWFC
jgi:hypothetical protein